VRKRGKGTSLSREDSSLYFVGSYLSPLLMIALFSLLLRAKDRGILGGLSSPVPVGNTPLFFFFFFFLVKPAMG